MRNCNHTDAFSFKAVQQQETTMARFDRPKSYREDEIIKSEDAARGGRLGVRVFEILVTSIILSAIAAGALYLWWGVSVTPTN